MKQLLHLVLMFFILIVFSGCKKECELPEQQIGKGLIISNARVVPLVPHIITWEMRTSYRVDSEEENGLDLRVIWDGGAAKDSIDFTSFTVLGVYARGGGCGVVYDRLVICNAPDQQCLYRVDIIECGECAMNSESMNFVLVPKLDPETTINYLIN